MDSKNARLTFSFGGTDIIGRRLIKGKKKGVIARDMSCLYDVWGSCAQLTFCLCINLPCALIECLFLFPLYFSKLAHGCCCCRYQQCPPWAISHICSYQHCPVISIPIYITSLIPWYIMHSRKRWNLAHESPFLLHVQSFPIFNHPTVPCILLSNYLDHQLLLFKRFFTWFALLKSCQFSILCLQQCYKENDNAVNVLWAYRFMLMCWKDTVEWL